MYLLKKSVYQWTCSVQTGAVQGYRNVSTIYRCIILYLKIHNLFNNFIMLNI